MKRYLLDTSALMALFDGEPGAPRVATLLQSCADGKVRVYASYFTRFEILYKVWKNEGETSGRQALTKCQALPIDWVEHSEALMLAAAAIKATAALSVADAWIAASANQANAILVHKDPEFTKLKLAQEALPFKA
jgi:predicted nucleic acid-binding protein